MEMLGAGYWLYKAAKERVIMDDPISRPYSNDAKAEEVAQPERIRGQWERIPYSFVGGYRCSICGCKSLSNKWNFCPDCGADMRKDGDGNG